MKRTVLLCFLLCMRLLLVAEHGPFARPYNPRNNHTTVNVSWEMQRNMAIGIGIIVLIVFLYGLKYWKKKR